MSRFHVLMLVAQSVSAVYNPCKDLFSYLKGQRQDIKDLEDKISTLLTDMISVCSRKEAIDRSLENSVSMEPSKEYTLMKTNMAVIWKKFNKCMDKYAKMTGNLPSAIPDFDISRVTFMIEELGEKKPKILTANFFKLAKLSRDIDKLSTQVSRILNGLGPEHMTQKKSKSNQEKLHDDDDNDLIGFSKYVTDVLRYLSNDGKRIGVIGPFGVGKTTVLRKLYNRLIETKLLRTGDSSSRLDNIIWIEYPLELMTEEKIIETLQNEIMVELNIKHESTNSIYQNANAISAFLCHRKYILFMDQVSNGINLNKLGLREGHKYGTVVIASRDQKAISSMIQHEVEIKTLLKVDAWKLFEKICGKIYDSRLRDCGDRIIECCGGIPWMISAVAKHLKNKKDESSWNDVKRILQSDAKSLNLIGLGEIAKIYEIMYEELEATSKKCLLYGALFPVEHSIYRDYLIECWIAEDFMVENVIQKLRLNRERGQTILNQLTERHLLEWCLDKKYVKMPLNFRRVALELEFPGEDKSEILVPSSDDVKPTEKTWATVKRMSLIGCKTELPENPESKNICTLLLQLKPKLKRLGDLFFYHMQSLKVLDLSHTEIGALPRSIDRLTNLRSLYLDGCHHLNMLPPQAGMLKKLEFLDICGTSLPSLPQEIGCMVDLRCLRASFSSKMRNCNSKGKEVNDPDEVMIPTEILSNLKKLEELSINTVLHIHGRIDVAEKLAKELADLEHLTTLCFNFPNVSSLDTFVTHSKSMNNAQTSWGPHTFRSFKISVGCHETRHSYESDVSGILAERLLRFSTNEKFSSGCKEVLKQASAFELIGHDSVETLSEFDLHALKVCVVERCSCLKNIVDGYTTTEFEGIVEESSSGVLQNLEKLHLYDLQLLQCIWDGPVVSESLINLTVLTLNACPKLTKVLDPALTRTLPRLKYLKVEDCRRISEIVEVPEGLNNSEQVDLSNILKSMEIIELLNLPRLQSICKCTSINWNSLGSIMVTRCSTLRNLSLTQSNAEKLALIECEKSWWDILELPDEVKERLCRLCRFKEEPPVLGVPPEGETSTSGRSVFIQASSNIGPVTPHGGKEIAEQVSSSNTSSIDDLGSNMNVVNGAGSPEEENPSITVDSPEPIDEIPRVTVRQTFGHLTSIRS